MAIYHGLEYLGSIRPRGGGFEAFAVAGARDCRLGTFANVADAKAAIRAARAAGGAS